MEKTGNSCRFESGFSLAAKLPKNQNPVQRQQISIIVYIFFWIFNVHFKTARIFITNAKQIDFKILYGMAAHMCYTD